MDTEQKIIHSVVEKHLREKEKSAFSLKEALGLAERELISLVGAGGKTTLMFRLANELFLAGKRVITTTTTRIMEPATEETPLLIVEADEEKAAGAARDALRKYHHITLAQERLGAGKLKGVTSRLIGDLWDSPEVEYLIVEADGAAGRPVKAPREWEPVIPPDSTLVIAILGIDGMGRDLQEENVFQAAIISRITGLPLGEKITDEAFALLLTHREGVFKGAPLSSRVVAFLNKVDVPDGIARARAVSRRILEKGHRQIERIVLGQVKKVPPAVEVILAR